ncbi:hypothetical protein AJ79_08273 [Helicocarpus griseus UAMH5409]|uniref:F-box domain-containing protein n=1 Tax=Helicocarpus griseus UAMH5409 TaxID=1447875 RepID=A0A2B7WUI0_9EURO|nr:hypothetical protein AJ79_08273 [Helicocarpus griseus UAMH5409]
MMKDFPPSYELATARDVWAIVADYIPSADLCAASLVCRRWHEIFVPFLWGAPASHFGTDNDAVYVALTRFRRTLKRARLEVRMLTHTIHLPPALSEIYGGPRPSWLLEVLEYLPNLQSLLVSQLPFFDHNSLIALRQKPSGESSYQQVYGLRLLLAQREPNTTSVGIREALLRFPFLNYLDLSFTTPARDHGVLTAISYMQHLQVLKLRGIGLRDADLEVVADSIKRRVRLLDVRNNMLTDESLRHLMQNCFLPPDVQISSPADGDVKFHFEWERSISPFSSILSADSLKSEEFDVHLMKQLMIPLTGRSSPQDLPHVGITHLYVADNQLSVEGLGSLLNSSRLHVLDGGTVKTAEAIWKRKGVGHLTDNESQLVVGVRFPGAEKLIPVLRHAAAENLTYLRVHHAVITEDASVSQEILSPARTPHSLSSRPPTPLGATAELDSSSTSQIYELLGDTEPIRHELADTSFLRPMPGVYDKSRAARLSTPDHELPEAVHPSPTSISRTERIQWLLKRRPPAITSASINNPNIPTPSLHPSHTPHLRTLILTDVPASISPAHLHIITRLTDFITACADEALLATLQALSDYSLPPGRLRARAERKHAKALFALERIVLEITPVARPDSSKRKGWDMHRYRSGAGVFSKSSTEDVDSENLWAAAEKDFSFFDEEGGEAGDECGIPDEDDDRGGVGAGDGGSRRRGGGGEGVNGGARTRNRNVDLRADMPVRSRGFSELEATTPYESQRQLQPARPTSAAAPAAGGFQQRSPQFLANRPRPSSSSLSSQSISSSTRPSPSPSRAPQQQQREAEEADIDVVAALAAFRKAKKAEYEALVRAERMRMREEHATTTTLTPSTASTSSYTASLTPRSPSPSPSLHMQIPEQVYVEGYWKGEVKIVRNPAPKGRSGFVDIYGNYFERGYLYP